MRTLDISIIASLALGWIGTAVAAEELCGNEVMTVACSADPTADGCLERLHACGRDEVILATFRAELKGLKPSQRYFVALAYYARATETASKGIHCAAIASARDSLDSYLYAVQDRYRTLGTYGSEEEMKATYHAARLREQLKGEPECLESGHTVTSLRRYVRQTAAQRIQDLFFGIPGDDGLDQMLASVWSTLQGAMGEFVTRAAETEALVQKTRAKLETARDAMLGPGGTLEHLGTLAGVTVDSAGQVHWNQTKLEETRLWVQSTIAAPIAVEAAKFKVATDNMTPEEFGRARDEVSRAARGALGHMTWGTNHLIVSYTTAPSGFTRARTAVFGGTGAVTVPANTLYSIHNLWHQYGKRPGSSICAAPTGTPWFCKDVPATN